MKNFYTRVVIALLLLCAVFTNKSMGMAQILSVANRVARMKAPQFGGVGLGLYAMGSLLQSKYVAAEQSSHKMEYEIVGSGFQEHGLMAAGIAGGKLLYPYGEYLAARVFQNPSIRNKAGFLCACFGLAMQPWLAKRWYQCSNKIDYQKPMTAAKRRENDRNKWKARRYLIPAFLICGMTFAYCDT